MLKKLRIKKINFLSTFLENRKGIPAYKSFTNTVSGETTCINEDANSTHKKSIYLINDFPSYLKADLCDNDWKVKTINTYKGSLIVVKNYNDANNYLKKKFKTPKRFRIYQKKLETSFNIEYKSFYGEISKTEYDYLFEEFHKMLKSRFLEKKVKNHDLSRWNIYHKVAFNLINNKEAVFFVIYSNSKPVSFYLNLLNNKTIYGYVKTYDIDYSKFSIGFINFIQQLRWCFENNIEVYDLLKGNYAYKNKLIDQEFYYQKHIIYNSKSILATLIGNVLIVKISLFYSVVNLLKKVKVDILYHKFSNFIYQNKIKNDTQKIIITNITEIPNTELNQIDINNKDYRFLKRITYKFLYHNDESMDTVKLFKFKNEADTYLISGKKQIQKIIFQ